MRASSTHQINHHKLLPMQVLLHPCLDLLHGIHECALVQWSYGAAAAHGGSRV